MKKHTLFSILSVLVLLTVMVSGVFVHASAEKSDGVLLRVLLRRLNISTRISAKTAGSCLLKGAGGTEMLMQTDTAFDIELRDNQLVVFAGGASISFGKTLDILRCGDAGASYGLYLMNSSAVYPGDLSLTIEEGKIQPILSASVEDYLLGVIPYEMNDSFPLEALKAQAVCARTYAVRRISKSRVYDVVDTTNDQVFKGVSASNQNAAKAVSETAGLVITVNGKIAEGFYSASNGGQTEIPVHVWGGKTDADCYSVQDDPWDTANPDSLVRSAEIAKDGSNLYRWMTRLIREAVFADIAWESGGYTKSENEFRIDRIRSVELKTPKYAAPSRLYTEMDMTLDVSGRKVSGGTIGPFASAGTFTVTLKLFPDVLAALGIEISGNGNEIVTVAETDTAFRVSAGRYGHGVGLSQRGAQWMALDGKKTFEEIIRFYFPGSEIRRMKVQQISTQSAPKNLIPRTPEKAENNIPAPHPTLMPVSAELLSGGAYIASVEGIDDGSTLNLRSRPSMASSVVMRLSKHQKLAVIDEYEVPGWAFVKTDSVEGYVMRSYLEKTE